MEWVKWAETSKLSLDFLEFSLKLDFPNDNFNESIFDIYWAFAIFEFDISFSLLNLFSEIVVLTWEDEMSELSFVETTIIIDIEEIDQNL